MCLVFSLKRSGLKGLFSHLLTYNVCLFIALLKGVFSMSPKPVVAKKVNTKEESVSGLEVDEVMGEDGTLSELVEGYHAREAQVEMAYEIELLIEAEDTLLAEAGTGTGKPLHI